MSWFEGIAWAQQPGAPPSTSEQLLFSVIVPIAFMFGIFYFLLIRPQTRKAAAHTKLLQGLKRNDEVVTTGGIVGRVADVDEKLLTIEIAPNVKVKIERAHVTGLANPSKALSKRKEKE
ncbi:MAG: preprotein translocase subunit YajC [Candidatus Binataceae bacterium]